MAYPELFGWWIATISWSIAFPVAVSIYLYRARPKKETGQRSKLRLVGDFTFVWFLIGLLGFYVLAVGRDSPVIFALGNLVVESLLIWYVLRAGRPATESEGTPGAHAEN